MKKLKMLDENNKREALKIKDKYLIDHINIPGCLIEVGFLSNNEDLTKLTNSYYKQDLAFTIYLGILEYLDYLK